MNVDVDLILKITVPLGTLVLGKYLDRLLTRCPKLIVYLGHASAFTIRTANPFIVHTHAIVIKNTGRLTANNVRIGHHILPENFNLYPSVAHSIERVENGVTEIVIPKLVPEEQITISYLYNPTLLWNQIHAHTKSDEGFAKELKVLPTPQLPQWMIRILRVLIFIGTVSLLYLLIKAIELILMRIL